jgi:amidase
MAAISFEQSGAFVERFSLSPTRDGPLKGLTFAAKDLIDVAGHHTGCGNPTWLATHPPAVVSAVCVEQLLAAGAQCEGKTVTDEIAFSLLGENFHYGTPLNPAAPERVPGGSSSGSASAVACGLVDFALGTDTGGSVRIPASNCGIWGLRTSHGRISVAGVMPLAPTFDTVGVFSRDIGVLQRAAAVLLPMDAAATSASTSVTIHLVEEAFASADSKVRQALGGVIERLRGVFRDRIAEVSLGAMCGDKRPADLKTWLTIFRVLQGTEIESCLGAWIAESHPTFGPATLAGLEYVKSLDRTRIGESIALREHFCQRLNESLSSGVLLCFPTAPTIAPLKGSRSADRNSDYYCRTLSVDAIAGIARLPQISMPLATVDGVPIGLSLAAAQGNDARLIEVAKNIAELISV